MKRTILSKLFKASFCLLFAASAFALETQREELSAPLESESAELKPLEDNYRAGQDEICETINGEVKCKKVEVQKSLNSPENRAKSESSERSEN